MSDITRRRLLKDSAIATVSTLAAGIGSGMYPGCPVLAQTPTDPSKPRTVDEPQALAKPPRLYACQEIPRVDIHAHANFEQAGAVAKLIEVMDTGRIAISVLLSGSDQSSSAEALKRYDQIREQTDGRILICPRDKNPEDGFWWSLDELEIFKRAGYAGTKIWCKYQQGLLAPNVVQKIRRQGELGLPAIGFHVADPPQGNFWKPNYWACIRDAEKLIHRCPETTFIMAHGFWLMNDNRGLDVLADYFDRYENLYVDLCAVYQWWDPPEPDFTKLRDFIIRFKDRLLFGTDGNPGYTTGERLAHAYRILESSDDQLQGFFGGEATNNYIRGLDLPVEVLNYIYYWNAARLVPEVRKSLLKLGYEIS